MFQRLLLKSEKTQMKDGQERVKTKDKTVHVCVCVYMCVCLSVCVGQPRIDINKEIVR